MDRHVAVPAGCGADRLPWASLSELVDDAAGRHPQRMALRDEHHESLTFGQLAELTSAIASGLIAHGLRPGDRVALTMANSLSWPVAWLGVVRAGGVAVPVNKSYRSTDLSFVLRDSGASIVVVDEDTRPMVESVLESCPQVSLVCQVTAKGAVTVSARGRGERGDDEGPWSGVANLQYTSGTTGFPKACVLSERYWLRAGWLAAEAGALGQDDVVLTAQPFSYIDPQWQTTMCLIAGATLVVLPRFSASRYWPAIREHGVTFAYVLGTMPVILYKQPPSPDDTAHRLRLMLCSGIPVDLHRAFEERWGVPWREAYGMTETGIDLVVPAAAAESVGSGIAGRAVATKQARIVTPEGLDVGQGHTGELIVRGEPMMERYHRRPEETAQTLRDGWLHTGDLAQHDGNGWISIVGRLKDMVRRGGENVAAAEVEGVLGSHPEVARTAVIPVPDPVTEEEVKAFVQLRDPSIDHTSAAQSIARHAGARLASFKVPRFIEFVDSFELTPSERIVKSALRRDDQRIGSFDVREDRWLTHSKERRGTVRCDR